MKLKPDTIDLIAKYLIDLSKIIFAGCLFSKFFMEKYFRLYVLIIGLIASAFFLCLAIYVKNKEAN